MELKKRLSNNFLTIWDCITLTSNIFSFHCSTHPHTSWLSGNLRLCVCLWVCTRPPTYTPMPQDSLVLAPRTHTHTHTEIFALIFMRACVPVCVSFFGKVGDTRKEVYLLICIFDLDCQATLELNAHK